ncbi:MAG: hypothetical protein KKD64_02810 [Alphaproteobacteria bacterium]|nr:hypothetical protein [Alphaproteobacteria bacterium]MBU0793813.1 hypothetical protein [Alphaproteobacteria bacterium]MBU0874387.1 hypothetical protein [Alphaproteobacteria bacterium]MBU1768568.1 hypothetical protein [Alphaproteobacteria bacterium]
MSEARLRYIAAKNYFQSALMLYRSPDRATGGREVITILPLCMLTAFALELYLKAWLLASNEPSNHVRAYGHRLRDLVESCINHGLPYQPELLKLVGQVMEGHGDYTYRYLEAGGEEKYPPDWPHAFEVLRWLDTVVDEKAGVSAAHGLTAGH